MTIEVCTRASTLASALDDKSGLIYSGYFEATALMTLAQNRDMLARLALVNGADWKAYKPLVKELEKRGGKREATEGTNIHAVVQAIVEGYDVSDVPEPTRSDGRAVVDYVHAQGWEILASEVFVATIDVLPGVGPCAGTLDLLLRDVESGIVFVGDIKTVSAPSEFKSKRLSWGIQTTIYANGSPYDPDIEVVRDQWGRPSVDTDYIDPWPSEWKPSTAYAVVLEVHRGKAKVRPIWLDLQKGAAHAKAAQIVRNLRKVADPTTEAPAW